jgi:5-methylcytosine-specific restriction protein A
MNVSAYETMLRSLGFTTVERGRKLQHPSAPPTLYFNRKRDGEVYFTGYQADRNVYAPELWQDLPPQQVKDAKPELITLLPIEGKVIEAFRDFLARSNTRSPEESAPRARRIGLARLISADSVKEAIAECDSLGRDVFLEKYGYKPSRLYPLKYNGQIYDSKAIAGVAVGKRHGTPLKANEFTGGVATVVRVLRQLGFELGPNVQPVQYLSPGTIYFRKDLVAWFGGQLQAGIWTPREFDVVFIFSGESGKAFGYRDGWTDQGVFRYTGEGQVGDMTFTGGNKAIRDHRENGKDLMLFEDLGKGKGDRYIGLFDCAAVETVEGTDRNLNARQIILFDLVPVKSAAVSNDVDVGETLPPPQRTLEELRAAAYAAAKTPGQNQKTSDTKRSWYERSAIVRDYVLARAKGVCEACDQKVPFLKKNGTPYLEPHHTHRLADEGPDHPEWVGAICPTCHRRIHSGQDGANGIPGSKRGCKRSHRTDFAH